MKQLVALLAITLLSVTAMAESKPVNFSLTPDVALFSREFLIKGLTLSFWGENEQQSLALGIVNGTPGDSAGAAGAIMVNYADYYTGVRGAGVNYSAQDTLGWDGALVN